MRYVDIQRKKKQRAEKFEKPDTNCMFPVGWYEDAAGKRGRQMPCKSKYCPCCSRVIKAFILSRAQEGFRDRRPRFLTLTLRKGCDHKQISKFWNTFRTLLSKPYVNLHGRREKGFHVWSEKHPHGYRYMWTKEKQENGTRHLHIILDAYIPQWLIKKLWIKATKGAGEITHITGTKSKKPSLRAIRSAAGYMSKYLTKAMDSDLSYKNDMKLDSEERYYTFSRHPAFKKIAPPKHVTVEKLEEMFPEVSKIKPPRGKDGKPKELTVSYIFEKRPDIKEKMIESGELTFFPVLERHVNPSGQYNTYHLNRWQRQYGPKVLQWYDDSTGFDYGIAVHRRYTIETYGDDFNKESLVVADRIAFNIARRVGLSHHGIRYEQLLQKYGLGDGGESVDEIPYEPSHYQWRSDIDASCDFVVDLGFDDVAKLQQAASLWSCFSLNNNLRICSGQ